jgi:hypothetical protein
LAAKIHSVSRVFKDKYAAKGAQRELHQIEVYYANLRALDQYVRKPLVGPLGSLEIFEPERDCRSSSNDRPIDWRDLWKGTTITHQVAGQDSGDMLSSDNARLLASLLAKRLRTIVSQNYCIRHR